jgi:hypothetical protein
MTRRILKEEKLLMMLVIKAITKRLTLLSLSFALVVGSNVGRADDIEIYFNSSNVTSSSEVTRSNLLFILDTSGSMLEPTTSGGTRISDLKKAMRIVLENVEDVNIGLMRFKSHVGGSVVYPISNIDDKATEVVGFSGSALVTEIVNTAFIEDDDDDGEEVVTGSSEPGAVAKNKVSLSDAVLDAFDFGGTQSAVGASTEFQIKQPQDDAFEEVKAGGCFIWNSVLAPTADWVPPKSKASSTASLSETLFLATAPGSEEPVTTSSPSSSSSSIKAVFTISVTSALPLNPTTSVALSSIFDIG